MNGQDVRCPECGAINHSLFLWETDGWMECEQCGCAAHLLKTSTGNLTDVRDCVWQIIKRLPSGSRAI